MVLIAVIYLNHDVTKWQMQHNKEERCDQHTGIRRQFYLTLQNTSNTKSEAEEEGQRRLLK